jgi:hypothetical protein
VHGNVSFHAARGRAAFVGVHEAHHAAVGVSEAGEDRRAAPLVLPLTQAPTPRIRRQGLAPEADQSAVTLPSVGRPNL